MAPSPENDNEPKAPDKNEKNNENVEIRSNTDFLDDHISSVRDLDSQDSNVSTLDDGQLKALLDEAINYKTPKDREGKSRIFKELLQEAEEDERNARAASASGPQLARYYNAAARRQRRNRGPPGDSVSVSNTHGGSLQDLVGGLYEVERVERVGRRSGGNSRRRHHHQHVSGRTVSVSARQREGGSLPSNVNAVNTSTLYPPDLRLFLNQSHPPVTNTSLLTNTQLEHETQSLKSDETNVETALSLLSVEKVSGEIGNQESGVQRVEYTVVDVEEDGAVEKATKEEVKGLLTSTKNVCYNSTENVTRYRFQSSEPAIAGPEHHQDPEKEEPAMEMTSTSSSRRLHSTSAFDGVTRHQYFNPLEEALHHHRIPRIKYTSRATLEVEPQTNAANSSVDKTISFPQFHHDTNSSGAASLQLDSDYNSVRCIVEGNANDSGALGGSIGGSGTVASAMRSTGSALGAASCGTLAPTQYRLLSMANSKLIGVDRFAAHHSDKKGVDENGNSVNTTSDSKKKKKCKVDRNVTVLKSENLPGHRADIIESIDLLVKYIEEDDSTSSKNTKPHHHHHHKQSINAEKSQKTLKRMRVKTKSEQHSSNPPVVKKSNSLEEISKTKLEDLMSEDPKKIRVKKQSTSEDGDRRIWNTEEETDFHVVTKKKKHKKRATKLIQQQQNKYYHYHRIEQSDEIVPGAPPQITAPQHDLKEPKRRKSACSVPPSEKSADSSDVDSVHSLPAATVHRRDDTSVGAHQTSPNSTSYADIARTNGGGSSASSNCSTNSGGSNQGSHLNAWKLSPPPAPSTLTPAQPPALHSDHFPELCSERDQPSSTTTQSLPPIPLTEFPKRTVSVLRHRSRPAVIILDDVNDVAASGPIATGPIQVSGLTFGFELNEQLLNDSDGDVDLVCGERHGRPEDVFARFQMPGAGAYTQTFNHDKIVTFVGLAWEDVVLQNNGKVQYYNGQ